MTAVDGANLVERNQRALVAELARLRAALAPSGGAGGGDPRQPAAPGPAPILDAVAAAFGLGAFERDMLLLCAGIELDAAFAAAVAAAGGATFGTAMAALREPHWSALRPSGPLRRWRLVEVGEGPTLATSPLRIDEAILHVLVGLPHEDERLRGAMAPAPRRESAASVFPSQQPAVELLAAHWRRDGEGLAQLVGADGAALRAVGESAAARLGRGAVIAAIDAGAGRADRDATALLLARHAILTGSVVLIDSHDADRADLPRMLDVAEAILGFGVACAAMLREPAAPGRRSAVRIDIGRPTSGEERDHWIDVLGPAARTLDGALDRVASQFRLGLRGLQGAAEEIASAAAAAAAASSEAGAGSNGLATVLWDACRRQSRGGLDDLAPRDAGAAGWDDLVLPAAALRSLRDLAAHARHQAVVLERWGFASRSGRGLGVTALFTGASGTGKTLAAQVIAAELRLDCHRIDLSAVVSKYIGETEKNLRRVFDAAEEGGAVLVFDEADALFGRRSEVRDSHDRFANIEVSDLLQRMERYRGMAILTTNNRAALDQAFLRRLRFVVHFPFPEAAERAEMWRRAFPAATPREAIDETKLARLAVTGGSIANIALAAAFLAAEERSPVTMRHLAEAARRECEKIERPLAEAEIGGWT